MESTRPTRLSDGHQLVDLPSGTRLECHVSLAPASAHTADELDDADQGKLALCLHPWAWLGGRMEDPCVFSVLADWSFWVDPGSLPSRRLQNYGMKF